MENDKKKGDDWLGEFSITHYTFALEDDPRYAGDKLVSVKGLEENDKHKEGFMFGPRGVIMQGTGFTSQKRYITIDWGKGGPKGRNTHFTYNIGGAGGVPAEWKTIAVDRSVIPLGSQVEIEIYKDMGPFIAKDTGRGVKGKHIDVFIGHVFIDEANKHGRLKSRVRIIKK